MEEEHVPSLYGSLQVFQIVKRRQMMIEHRLLQTFRLVPTKSCGSAFLLLPDELSRLGLDYSLSIATL